ncbi:MAG: hypothetical protein EA397_06170 [Deltaproteobacteria bacterium]|nr:MAG: hypothetical protein EA397_06170 [Deltaproteobacteria bacterium]
MFQRPAPPTLVLSGVLCIGLWGCAEPEPPWYTQLQADSPCYRVNLMDGLDEDDTEELRDLFACLNHHGHLRALERTVDALESPSRDGVPAGIELARAVNAMPQADVDVMELAQGLMGVVDMPPSAITHSQDLVLELLYGQHHVNVRRESFDLHAPANLQGGAIAPLRPVVPVITTALYEHPETTDLVSELLVDPETHRWIRTVTAWSASEHPSVREPLRGLLPELGRAIVSTRSPDNDLWVGASGDSLRDLVDAASQHRAGGDFVEVVSPMVDPMVNDLTVRTQLPAELVALYDEGHLEHAPRQLTLLVELNAEGQLVQPGQDSALVSLVRLIHNTNQPMDCRVTVFGSTFEFNLGNLAVFLLRVLADQDPDNVQSAAGMVGSVLGSGVGEGVLNAIADSQACSALTPQVALDLQALDLFGIPQTRHLTHTLIRILHVLHHGDQDQVPNVVDLLAAAWAHDVVYPLDELVRDMGPSPAFNHAVNLVPVMNRPQDFGVTAGDEPATNLSDLLAVSRWLVEQDQGRTGWQRLQPLLLPATTYDETWDAVHTVAPVLGHRSSALSRAHELLPPMLDADPDLRLLQQLSPILGDPNLVGPTLRLASTEPVLDELFATHPAHEQPEVPLAFAAHLIRSGTLDDLFRLIRTITDDLRTLEARQD